MKRKLILGGAAVALLTGLHPLPAKAIDLEVSGFVRQEFAVKITGNEDENDFAGNPYNNQSETYHGLAAFASPSYVKYTGATPTTLYGRPAYYAKSYTFNQMDTRFELNLDSHLTDDLTAHIKVRGVYDEIGKIEDAFRGSNLYGGNFGYGHDSGGNLLEVTSKDAMLDLPSAYVDYNHGSLWLRAGNQQIAWGEALFFRVADQVDGLDLRRHSVLGVAGEEYSDTRVPSPGLRGSYDFGGDSDFTIEAYTQKFQPTDLPGPNSPYNVIPSQFIIDDRSGYDAVSGEMNFGARATFNLGDYGVTAFAIAEHDSTGVYKWAESRQTGNGGVVPQSAFTTTPYGVYSAEEWFHYAAMSHLDGLGGLDTALNNFGTGQDNGTVNGYYIANACAQKTGGPAPTGSGTINVNNAEANCILDSFFGAYGGLTGYLSRTYPYQKVFGASVNHIFDGEPDSFMDQLIARAEFSYTPHKQFTNPTLGTPLNHSEYQLALILEKYYKFSDNIPATYFVGQYLHKSASNIYGQTTAGMDDAPGSSPRGQTGGTNYFAFALQQPSPTLKYRFDFTMLTDIQGGWLFQPGVKFKPSEHLQFDLYANLIYSTASENNYTNLAEGNLQDREIFARMTYFF